MYLCVCMHVDMCKGVFGTGIPRFYPKSVEPCYFTALKPPSVSMTDTLRCTALSPCPGEKVPVGQKLQSWDQKRSWGLLAEYCTALPANRERASGGWRMAVLLFLYNKRGSL